MAWRRAENRNERSDMKKDTCRKCEGYGFVHTGNAWQFCDECATMPKPKIEAANRKLADDASKIARANKAYAAIEAVTWAMLLKASSLAMDAEEPLWATALTLVALFWSYSAVSRILKCIANRR